ncbi:MAG: methylmalonyl-CoA mutase subunit beta [Flavobacteriaceae bacterium]
MAQQLFSEFDAVSAKAWKQKIQVDLKGADYNDTLVWESPEGIHVKPFYHSEDLHNGGVPAIPSPTSWHIGQEIVAGHVPSANKKALDALQRGAESLVVTIPSAAIDIEKVLSGIDIAATPLFFKLQFLDPDYVQGIQALATAEGAENHLNLNLIGNLARSGNWFYDLKKDHELLENIVAKTKGSPQSSLLGVDVALYQNAGANIVQQLAYALAHANEYLNHGLLKTMQGITFTVAMGSNYFFEIAKLRALRLLWATLAAEYGISAPCTILATPSKRNKTLYDYNVNLLRTTSECMSAILGGADTVYNQPYDRIYHKDNEFGERIARNQLLVLKNEGHFDKVANATEGAYYIETLTSQLAEKALALFKNIEKGGGFLRQLKENIIQNKIRESAQKEQLGFDQKKEILVGTNAYENEEDRMKETIEVSPFAKTDKRKTLIEPILEKRLAEKLEQKRLNDE